MLTLTAETADPVTVCDELLSGGGAVKLTGLFTSEQIETARAIIMAESDRAAAKVTHFQGQAMADGRANLQRRVWNLLAKGEVFSQMAAHPVIMDSSAAGWEPSSSWDRSRRTAFCRAVPARNRMWTIPIGISTHPKRIRWG
ncbi:MAG: hypothetical protein NXH91_11760 [Phyllobacteriaceae bacterium]|nr:hypothetical protein [Phyllobacteriaceae bacterium]